MRSRYCLLLVLILTGSFACQDAADEQIDAELDAGLDAAGDVDASPDSGPDPVSWTVVETTTDDGEIIIEKILYPSGSLSIFGQLCRPATTGPFQAIVVNHGGWVGLGNEWNGGACAEFARNGYVVLQSSYRGEDGSDGDIEICGGEVDDVLALVDLALQRPELIDASNVAMWGGSHGGCITLRAVARGAPVVAAVAAVPPTELISLHAFWKEGLASDAPAFKKQVWSTLSAAVEDAFGGTPAGVPAVYQERSPVHYLDEIEATGTPVMVVHGGDDYFVPAQQGCALAEAGFEARYVVDQIGTVALLAPEQCAGTVVEWNTQARPVGDWPASLYLQIYSDMGHGFEGTTGTVALFDTLDFLQAKLD